jgi:hypothetical protein
VPRRPDPFREIRLVLLSSLRGANLWSRGPVTRIDLAVGAYDEISSAEVPGVTERLLAALPLLVEHRCSVGERGGFVTRLRRGTYAPHIVEHVALALQECLGHEVGFGRARGGERPGEYTVVFEHRHAGVGLRAAALALDLVQRAFAGTLESADAVLRELEALAASPDAPPLRQRVLCAITGGAGRDAAREGLLRLGPGDEEAPIVEVAPAYLLSAGLPYARSDFALVLDVEPTDVPARYREPEPARRLLSVVADAVPPGGFVVVPAGEAELQARIRDAGPRVAVFAADGGPIPREARDADAAAWVRGGRIVVECQGRTRDAGALRVGVAAPAQVAAALAATLWTAGGRDGEEEHGKAASTQRAERNVRTA